MKEYLNNIPQKYHSRIMIHTHHRLVRKFDLQGIHYTRVHLESTLKNWWQNKRLASITKDMIKTASHRKLTSLYEKSEMVYDYVFLNPVFDTITDRLQSGLYDESIKRAINKSGHKIVAMGGIDIRRIERIVDLGFHGMALNNCLWSQADPVAEYLKILKRCEELGINTL